MVDYYGALADGLPHQLTRAIQPNGNPPITLLYNSIPMTSTSVPSFTNHINNQMAAPPVRHVSLLYLCLVENSFNKWSVPYHSEYIVALLRKAMRCRW